MFLRKRLILYCSGEGDIRCILLPFALSRIPPGPMDVLGRPTRPPGVGNAWWGFANKELKPAPHGEALPMKLSIGEN